MNKQVEVLDPRDVIREELKSRNWTQEDLAQIIGRQTSYINRILSGNIGITARTAQELGHAFGTGGMFWMNLETAYKLSKLGSKK
jgi:addiction module HigA family antidote